MRSTLIRLALFLLGLAAFAGSDLQARGGGGRFFSRNAQPVPVYHTPEPIAVAPVAVTHPGYQLHMWNRGLRRWEPVGMSEKSHTGLHTKGKNNLKGKHVHPKYWHDAKAYTGTIFTVTIADPMFWPEPPTEEPLPKFCLHHCDAGWKYKDEGTDYEMLYESCLNTGLEFIECFETCESRYTVMFFTVCAEKDMMSDGRPCCSRDEGKACVPVCVPQQKKHRCLLGGLLRSRRGCRSGCGW